jgi:hypothetical protein
MNRSEFADACAETGHGTALDFELLTLLLLHWGRTDACVLGALVSGTPGKAGNKRRIFRDGRAALRPAPSRGKLALRCVGWNSPLANVPLMYPGAGLGYI